MPTARPASSRSSQNLSVTGLPISLTEFGVQTGGSTTTAQAATYLTETMRMVFGTPNATTFDIWGFWANDIWSQAPLAALMDANWNLTAAGRRLRTADVAVDDRSDAAGRPRRHDRLQRLLRPYTTSRSTARRSLWISPRAIRSIRWSSRRATTTATARSTPPTTPSGATRGLDRRLPRRRQWRPHDRRSRLRDLEKRLRHQLRQRRGPWFSRRPGADLSHARGSRIRLLAPNRRRIASSVAR